MNQFNWIDGLKVVGACPPSLDWIERTKPASFREAVMMCERYQWLSWLCEVLPEELLSTKDFQVLLVQEEDLIASENPQEDWTKDTLLALLEYWRGEVLRQLDVTEKWLVKEASNYDGPSEASQR